jgi:undecaprenyl-diphosphatase
MQAERKGARLGSIASHSIQDNMRTLLRNGVALVISLAAGLAHAQSHGLFGIDHTVKYDNDGLISRNLQLGVEYGTLAFIVGGALWEGGGSRLGRTYWQSIDAAAAGTVSSTVLKGVFTRSRPMQSGDPNLWFQGKSHYSFPSGEVTFVTAAVTPFVLEYGEDHPAVYALGLLPFYDAIARVKVGGHWQSDVLAGLALGGAAGYLAHRQDNPWMLRALPGGAAVGFKTRF